MINESLGIVAVENEKRKLIKTSESAAELSARRLQAPSDFPPRLLVPSKVGARVVCTGLTPPHLLQHFRLFCL